MGQRLGGNPADGGFGMVEMVAALIVIGLASAASAAFFITSIGGANGNKSRTTAAYVADQAIEEITALPPSDLVYGRTKTAVTALWATAAATKLKISSQDDETSGADYDTNTGHTPYIPTQTTRTVNNIVFTVYNFIDVCWMDVAAGVCGPNQHPATGHDTNKEYRASVDVHWVSSGGCHAGCDYSTSTIIDPSSDPTYNSDLDIPVIATFTPSAFYTYNTLADVAAIDASAPCVLNGNTYTGDLVKVTTSAGLDAGATIRVSSGGGTVPGAEVTEVGSSEIDFCLQTADVPGNYFITVLNPDGGHANQPITVNGVVTKAAWNTSTRALTLSGSGFEPNATLSDTLGNSMSSATVTNNYPHGADTAVIPNFSPPTNGGKDTITITNPDTTSISYTITAPKVTSSGLTGYSGHPNSIAVAGTGFVQGLTVAMTAGNCTNPSVTYNSSGAATLNFTGGSVNTFCTFHFINPDGGSTGNFNVTNQAYPPQVTSVSPTYVEVNTSTSLTLSGSGFQSGMSATRSGGSCTSVSQPAVSNGGSTATLTLTSSGGTGTCTVTLTNPDGGTTTFTETVTKISISGMTEYSTTYQHTKTYTWTVTGTAFSSSATVTMSEKAGNNTQSLAVSATSVSSSTQLTFNATPFNTGKANYTVTVTNPSGSSASYSLNNFTVS
ncbi:MAG TPA: hypothetical protein VG650_11440 [Mycobacteriales bacterium]|nr:hypothetical protein [Mycobacteriales bacterium]